MTYLLQGTWLGGRIHLTGRLPPDKPKPAKPVAQGQVRIERARLSGLGPALGYDRALQPLRGLLNLQFDFTLEGPDYTPAGRGRVAVLRPRWADTLLSDVIRADLTLTPGQLRLENLSGTLAGGLLGGRMAVGLGQQNRSWFTVSLAGADAARLLAPWPALASRLQGRVDARLRGTLGREWNGAGEVNVTQGRFLGIELSQWRLPLDWALTPAYGRGQLEIRDSVAQIAHGQAAGRASLTWGAGTRLEGNVRLYRVDLRDALRPFTSSSQLGSGLLSGRIDFGGTDVQSLDDVNALVEATLAQTQALQFPVLSQIVPFLLPGQSSATFTSGNLRGRLDRGIFRLQQLGLQGSTLPIFIDGTITLAGRLDLSVTAGKSPAGTPPLLQVFRGTFSSNQSLPTAFLQQLSSLFVNRLVHLRVTGTVRNPQVQVQPLPVLTEGALRFFVTGGNGR